MDLSAFLFNPSSGRGKALHKRRSIESALKKHGISYQWFTSKSEKHLKKLARSTARDFPIVVAVGGDTTFQIVASELLAIKTSAVMGMLGTGSSNDITRSLGIPGIKQLCAAIRAGEFRRMDVGIVEMPGGKQPILFLGALSLGMGVEVNRYMAGFWARHPVLKKGGDWIQAAAGIWGMRDSFRRSAVPSRIRIQTDELDEWIEYALLVFTNINYYAGGLKLTPDTMPCDGRLGCCVIQTYNWRQSLALGWRAKGGRHIHDPRVRILSGSSFILQSQDPLEVQVDGEVIRTGTEIRISVKPGALRILG